MRALDADADAAWRAYGSELPTAVRCDLVLRNLAMLYPAAFAPGPVLDLPGWHEDDPWGSGFERPAAAVVEGLFAARAVPASAAAALEQALAAWGLPASGGEAALAEKLSPSTNLVVAGGRAASAVARAFLGGERLSPRAQIVLVGEGPGERQAIGVACALLADKGVPLFASPARAGDEAWRAWALREKQRLGVAQARLRVTSSDASAGALAAADALAEALGAADAIEIGEA